MAINFPKFTISRTLKTALAAIAFVVVSGGLWQSRLVDSFAICMASLTAPGSQSAAAATISPPRPEQKRP